ncbi:MAG: response regulator transcription factor [Clostridia bacterium]|nr:response regulator transcription factor [Clostridia bacterium]
MMVNIAVCDDSEHDLLKIEHELKNYEQLKHVNMKVHSFQSSEALIYEIEEKKLADIYILDVAMPKVNGFQLAEKIRKQTSTSIIIFLTTMEDQAPKGYRFKALRYIIKYNLQRDFAEAMDCALAELADATTNTVTLHYYNDIWRVPYKEIIYVSKAPRQVIVSTATLGELTDSSGIADFYNTLNDKRFIFIDRSCFVNVDYISQITGYDLKLTTGEVLSISRRSLQNVKQAIMLQWKL